MDKSISCLHYQGILTRVNSNTINYCMISTNLNLDKEANELKRGIEYIRISFGYGQTGNPFI